MKYLFAILLLVACSAEEPIPATTEYQSNSLDTLTYEEYYQHYLEEVEYYQTLDLLDSIQQAEAYNYYLWYGRGYSSD